MNEEESHLFIPNVKKERDSDPTRGLKGTACSELGVLPSMIG